MYLPCLMSDVVGYQSLSWCSPPYQKPSAGLNSFLSSSWHRFQASGGWGRCLRKCVSPELGVNVGAAAMKLFLALRSAPFSLSISPRGRSASALIEPRCQVMLWLHSYLQLLESVTFLLDIFSFRPWSRKRAQDIFCRRDMWSSFAHDINLL